MIGWLIYQQEDAGQNRSYIEWFLTEAKRQQIDLILVSREDLTVGIDHQLHRIYIDGVQQALPDFVINRSIEPMLQHFFELCQVPVFNDVKTAEIANHKARTHLELSKLNIPMLPTYFIHGRALPNKVPLPYPVIVKSATGRGGKEVYWIGDDPTWQRFQQRCTKQDYIIQPTYVQPGKDVRVFVIANEIIAAVLRHNETDFRANFKLGGKAIPYHLSDENKRMIKRITQHFSFGLVGIDFLLDHDGNLLFNEIEDVVGSRILSEVSDVNLLERYIQYIKHTVQQE